MKKLLLLFLLILAPIFAQQKLDADYDSGQELILIERSPVSIKDREDFYLKPYPMTMKLYSIYWNPSNNQYYYVKDGSDLTKTNDLTYKLDPKKQEQTLAKISLDNELVYAGYISSTKRLYINPKTKEQFIKILIPIVDNDIITPKISVHRDNFRLRYVDSAGRGTDRNPKNGAMPNFYEGL